MITEISFATSESPNWVTKKSVPIPNTPLSPSILPNSSSIIIKCKNPSEEEVSQFLAALEAVSNQEEEEDDEEAEEEPEEDRPVAPTITINIFTNVSNVESLQELQFCEALIDAVPVAAEYKVGMLQELVLRKLQINDSQCIIVRSTSVSFKKTHSLRKGYLTEILRRERTRVAFILFG